MAGPGIDQHRIDRALGIGGNAACGCDLQIHAFAQRLVLAHHRHAHAFERRMVFAGGRDDGRGHREPEAGTTFGRGINADLAAHRVDQALGNRQAQTGAAELAGMAGIGLHEFLEDFLALGGRHAHAGVAHFKAQEGRPVLRDGFDFDADAAFFGELDGIAHQVGDHLTQAAFIGQDLQRHVGRDDGGDFHALGLAARAQKLGDVAQHGAQVDLVLVQVQHAGFDLGEVQDIADQGQQCFARLGDGFRIGALLRSQLRLQQKTPHAQHAVHRRADFVAHGGQEAGLGAAGFLGAFLGLGQRVFQRLAVGDVAADALHFDQAAMGIAHREIFPGDPAITLRGFHMLVVARAVAARFQKTAEQGRAAFGMRLGREGITDGARRDQAEKLEEGIVAIGETAGGIAAEDGVALRVDQPLVTRLALVQPRIHHRGILQRGFQAARHGFELGALGLQHFLAFARRQDVGQQEGQRHGHQGAEAERRDQSQMARPQDVGDGGHQHDAGHHPEHDPDDPRK